MPKKFISGDDAIAEGIRLTRPGYISTCTHPLQSVVIKRLSDMIASDELDATFFCAAGGCSALSAAMGAAAAGCRTFTASSSQELLGMARLLTQISSAGLALVMMNAKSACTTPWNVYGDQCESLSLLDLGWIQAYARDAQEALDLLLMGFRIAENERVRTPFMLNLDDPAFTQTYEPVDVPEQEDVDEFLPAIDTVSRCNFKQSKSMESSARQDTHDILVVSQHEQMMNVFDVLPQLEKDFARIFGRSYDGPLETYCCEDAQYVIVVLGSIFGLVCEAVDEFRKAQVKAGALRIRYMRPFPDEQIVSALKGKQAFCVLEQDISFGYEGTVFTNVASAMFTAGVHVRGLSALGGLGGRDITADDVHAIFARMQSPETPSHMILGLGAPQ